MCRPEEIAVVIPCLDEGRAIGPLISAVREHIPNVFVVDDGSSDNTARIAKAAGAVVLNHDSPRGKGASLRTGFQAAISQGFSWALTLDGDGQHLPTDIPEFLRRAEHSTAPLLVGNRMSQPHSMPLIRQCVNRWMSSTISRFCNASVPDSQCGFRLLNLNIWKRLPFQSDHFEIESEMIIRILHAGYSIEFVPVQTRYALEVSKIHPVRDTLRWFRWWIAIRHELAANPFSRVQQQRYESHPQDAAA